MKKYIYQLAATLLSLAILIFFFQVVWFLAIPLLIVFLCIWGINFMRSFWERGKVPPSRSSHTHPVIDVEFQEIDK